MGAGGGGGRLVTGHDDGRNGHGKRSWREAPAYRGTNHLPHRRAGAGVAGWIIKRC